MFPRLNLERNIDVATGQLTCEGTVKVSLLQAMEAHRVAGG
jgi:hypothetical protein